MVAVADPRQPHFGEPFFLQWNITDRCNLACTHCYRETPAPADATPDLSLPSLLHVLDNFETLLGTLNRHGRVMLSGGEPLLSPHLFDLAEACRARSLPVRVLSNGSLIDLPAATALADAGVRAVQVSIEGPPNIHDRVRGPGSHAAALAGMRALRTAGIEVTLAFTLTSENRTSLPAVARLARRHADRFHVARHVPIGRGLALDARPLSADELRDVFEWLNRHRQSWRADRPWRHRTLDVPLRDPLWKALLATPTGCDRCVGGCSIGYNGICVESDATVYPCRRLPIPLGNALNTPLAEMWQHPALGRLRDRDALEGKCGACKLRWTCGGCRAVAEALGGHPLAEDPQCWRG